MSIGTDFTTYKTKLLYKIVENSDLIQAVANNKSNFLDDRLNIEPASTIYNNVFPYRISPKKIIEPKSLITMRFSGFKPIGTKFKEGNIYFYIICHNSLVTTDYGLRYDLIWNELNSLFNQSRDIGIGKLELLEVSDLDVNDDFMGSVCAFRVTDFM